MRLTYKLKNMENKIGFILIKMMKIVHITILIARRLQIKSTLLDTGYFKMIFDFLLNNLIYQFRIAGCKYM